MTKLFSEHENQSRNIKRKPHNLEAVLKKPKTQNKTREKNRRYIIAVYFGQKGITIPQFGDDFCKKKYPRKETPQKKPIYCTKKMAVCNVQFHFEYKIRNSSAKSVRMRIILKKKASQCSLSLQKFVKKIRGVQRTQLDYRKISCNCNCFLVLWAKPTNRQWVALRF